MVNLSMSKWAKVFSFLFLSAFLTLSAQDGDQAARLFDNGQTFMNAGKHKEALTDFEQIITAYPDSEWAPRALLEIGKHYLKTIKEPGTARQYFERILANYSGSDSAPAAFFFKADIVDQTAYDREALEGAVADLIRMNNLYPDNNHRDDAMFLFGKLNMRLQAYEESLSWFQRLEFNFPNHPLVPRALLLSSHVAYRSGKAEQALLILARLQTRYPNSPETEKAESFLRLLDRFLKGTGNYEIDNGFFGRAPKTFNNPSRILVDQKGQLAVLDSKGAWFANIHDSAPPSFIAGRDIMDFTTDRAGSLTIVYDTKILRKGDGLGLPGLIHDGDTLKDIRSAAIDDFGLYYVVNDGRDLIAFFPDGKPANAFQANRPGLVRGDGSGIWVLNRDQNGFIIYDTAFQVSGNGPSGLDNIEDFRFDPYGNLYVLHDKGNQVSIFHQNGKLFQNLNLKKGPYPLKQAEGIGVDASGAVYLADRRSGSVYRFM